MSKKIIAVLTIATILFVCVFAACDKKDEYNIYIDDKEYDFVTDENGERVLDDEGRFLVYSKDENGKNVTNESGEKVTEARPFEALENGGVVEDYGYKITLPKGWNYTDDAGEFENNSTKQKFKIKAVKTIYDEYRGNAFLLFEELEKKGMDATWRDDLELGDSFENVFRVTFADEENIMVIYVFQNSGNTYEIVFESPKIETAIDDSVAFCENIEFKPYTYYPELTAESTEETAEETVTEATTK